ncbi:MAG: hypothetical protein A2677_02190 [Candidatus Komeilibacteria bacterium RIFCSPHIGHO2_01_FULL_52_14]|uniref:Shedu protein SduA C-terminal domain-containing protein n=1 Tax=Candidatus Komeilibacteria bacterium RIFCSPHIGHO2_01_FULL_52_14 TaxID=1798549 RepID=A0A1G2BJL3_9BACT|nr:MAG: hypothetical protein A2677_02190 [Candidatus Komeilibacteria bacterium RIFCSPHIGHO2_01_FULL_52_14]
MTSEILKTKTRTKEIYHAVSTDPKFDVKSREVFKKKPYEIVFPFNRQGKQKYSLISEIHFDGVSRLDLKGQRGMTRGYGFTQDTVPVVSILNESFSAIAKVVISNKPTSIDRRKGEFILNIEDYKTIYSTLRPKNQKHSKDLRIAINNILAQAGGLGLRAKKIPYVAGSLKGTLREVASSGGKLSDSDSAALLDFAQNKIENYDVDAATLIHTKEKIDKVYFEKVISRFEKLLAIKKGVGAKKLEQRWHYFFKDNSWIFSYLFAAPHFLFQDEYYVGGQKGTGKEARYADFIYKNKLIDSATIIEIKTHKTKILHNTAYRVSGRVYPISSDITGAINQVLDQKNTLLKNYSSVAQGDFEVFDPKCIVVAGTIGSIPKERIKSFDMFRSNLRNIEVVCFDELLSKAKLLLSHFMKSKTTKAKKKKK